jgi:hypothetical protein
LEIKPITVVEVPPFPSRADTVWSSKERYEFIDYIARNPLAGDEIPGTGGLRKVRWSRQGIGKRSGVRVIYFFYNERYPIFLLTVYPKGKQKDLTSDEKKKLAAFVRDAKAKMKEIGSGGEYV